MTDLDPKLDAYRWLTGPEADPWLTEASARNSSGGRLVEITSWLRRSLSPQRAHVILETLDLRGRARAKFATAERLYFTRVGLEQATDCWVAAYKARRFTAGDRVLDACCGLGGDLLALAVRGPVEGIDRDPIAALLAGANARALGVQAAVACRSVSAADFAPGVAWHMDPDRRAAGRRTTHVDAHSPSAREIDGWRVAAPDAAVKLSPATSPPAAWEASAECEWIGRAGQCRQLLTWFGRLARHPGQRVATILGPLSDVPASVVVGSGRGRPPLAARLGDFVYEPDPTILAAHLSAEVAARHGLAALCADSAYLTSDRRVQDAALAGFAVSAVLPFQLRKLKSWLREHRIGRLEVKKRGLHLDPARVQRQLTVPGDLSATLLITPGPSGTLAIVAERLVDPAC